jgi:eukaryotic-like serine/threonine-protein kinase
MREQANAEKSDLQTRGEMQPGTVLADRYRIERLLSRGGMGAVYEATQLGLDRAVAVKLLLPVFSSDAKMRERFQREARSAASLSHPNIIQVYDYGVAEAGPYIVMELVRGESLRRHIARSAVAPELAARLAEQVCAAVAAAHAAGIIHRDLKPDNILVEERADGLFAKVLDFGIAKLRDHRRAAGQPDGEAADTGDLTGASVIGSPNYMSPEQCMGLELDARSDVYSLGVVLYEMLTGRVPFADPSAVKVLLQHVNETPCRLTAIRPDLSAALEAVVLRALAKDRAARHATALELATDFRLALSNPVAFETRPTSAITGQGGQITPPPGDAYATNVAPTLPAINLSPIRAGQSSAPGSVSSSSGAGRRLAILPLRNLTGDADIEYLGFALADSVITQLCCLKSLVVRPSSAVERYRGQVVDPQTVGEELQVNTILTGSYLKAGSRFRVNAQLIDVVRNEMIWQERIDAEFDNVLALQDRICEALIAGLRLRLSTEEQCAVKCEEAAHPLAHELYLRAVACGNTLDEHRRALDLLESAIKLDEHYAPAWAALGGRYVIARHYFHDETMLAKAEAALEKALELKPQLPAAHFWLAFHYGEINDLQKGLVAIRKLLEVAPNSEYAYEVLAHAYEYAGLPDVSLALFRKALEINPVAHPQIIGMLLYQKGEMVEARRALETCPQREKFPEVNYWLAILDMVEGQPESAAARLEAIIVAPGAVKLHEMARGLLAAIRGEREEGRRVVRSITDSGYKFPAYVYYLLAQIYAQLGDAEACFEMLRENVKLGYGNHPFLMSDPLLAPVRSHAGFAEVAAMMRRAQTQIQLMLVAGQ